MCVAGGEGQREKRWNFTGHLEGFSEVEPFVLDLTEIPFILQVEHSMEQRDENCTVPSENNKTSAIPGERNSHRNGWEMRLKAGLESDLERDIIAREFTQCRERSGKPPGFLRG